MNRHNARPRAFPVVIFLLVLTPILFGFAASDADVIGAPGEEPTQYGTEALSRQPPCAACVATIDAAVEDGRILEVTGLFYKLFLILAPDLVSDEFKCIDHKKELVVTVREIRINQPRLEGKTVILKGQFMGWSAEGGDDLGVPITRSDWVFKDATGSIYVTGGNPPGLRPGYPEYKGTEIVLTATVIANKYGLPCLNFVSATVKGSEGGSK